MVLPAQINMDDENYDSDFENDPPVIDPRHERPHKNITGPPSLTHEKEENDAYETEFEEEEVPTKESYSRNRKRNVASSGNASLMDESNSYENEYFDNDFEVDVEKIEKPVGARPSPKSQRSQFDKDDASPSSKAKVIYPSDSPNSSPIYGEIIVKEDSTNELVSENVVSSLVRPESKGSPLYYGKATSKIVVMSPAKIVKEDPNLILGRDEIPIKSHQEIDGTGDTSYILDSSIKAASKTMTRRKKTEGAGEYGPVADGLEPFYNENESYNFTPKRRRESPVPNASSDDILDEVSPLQRIQKESESPVSDSLRTLKEHIKHQKALRKAEKIPEQFVVTSSYSQHRKAVKQRAWEVSSDEESSVVSQSTPVSQAGKPRGGREGCKWIQLYNKHALTQPHTRIHIICPNHFLKTTIVPFINCILSSHFSSACLYAKIHHVSILSNTRTFTISITGAVGGCSLLIRTRALGPSSGPRQRPWS